MSNIFISAPKGISIKSLKEYLDWIIEETEYDENSKIVELNLIEEKEHKLLYSVGS